MGALVDRTWNEGKGARYIQLRNFEFGCGKSWGERAGPGRYFSPIRSSFYVGVSLLFLFLSRSYQILSCSNSV